MYRSSPFRSTLNTGSITALDMCEVCTEAVHSEALSTRVTLQLSTCVKYVPKQSIQFRSTLNTGYGLHYTALDMCEVCTEAVHSVALWTRVTLQLWTCVKYVPKRSIPQHLNTGYITALDMCEVCTEAVHSVALWTRVTLHLWTCVKYVPKQSVP